MFKKATKTKSKLRLAIFGPSGSGKTMSALRIATGMTDKIAVIDSERGSASKYSDRFSFDVMEIDKLTIDALESAIIEAATGGYGLLIIDSLSHAWQELLEEMDKLSNAKYRGNSFSAWREGTPKQRKLVDAILGFSGHIIATMRTKTEWIVEKDDRGKTKPVRVGLSPEQGKGIEYEFDLLIELTPEHDANVIKDRTGKFQDQIISKPSEELGKQILSWLNEGGEPAAKPTLPANKPASTKPVAKPPVKLPEPSEQEADVLFKIYTALAECDKMAGKVLSKERLNKYLWSSHKRYPSDASKVAAIVDFIQNSDGVLDKLIVK